MTGAGTCPDLPMRRVVGTWWPLAGSWLLMGMELPLVSAAMARLADPEISLAAYGGIVFPISLIIESPIIMLLSASTALSRDWASYLLLRRFMIWTGAILTILHALVAFTPLFDLVVGRIINPPPEVLGPSRIGLMIMTPWTWAIAYRRFQQGVLIRFGRSHLVGLGTLVRLGTNLLVLAIGLIVGGVPGIVIGTLAISLAVLAESFFVGVITKPVLEARLKQAKPVHPPLTMRDFRSFYAPLAMTSLLNHIAMPIISAGISRMPRALDSLAVLPVISGMTFMLRSLGFAYNEVVVALLDEPGSYRNLRRFAIYLGSATAAGLLLVAATPLAGLYMRHFAGLAPHLAGLATSAIWISVITPALNTAMSWFQGALVQSRRTRGITESVGIYLLAAGLVMILGVRHGAITGIYVGMAGMVVGMLLQNVWLCHRSVPARRAVRERDSALQPPCPSPGPDWGAGGR